MKISVIIPVYNVEEWIEASLDSVLEQDYPDLECIVVDDFGSDHSMDIVRRIRAEHPRRDIINIAVHSKNLGLAGARNTGVEVSKGDYIFFLDSDDKLQDSGVLSALAEAAVRYKPDFVQGNYLRVDPVTGATVAALYYNPAHPVYTDGEIAANATRLNFTNATNKLISRHFLSEKNISFTDGLIYEDALWGFHVYSCVRSVVTVPEVTYAHNLRQGSIMRSQGNEHKIDSLIYIIGKMCRGGKHDAYVDQNIAQNAVYTLKMMFTEEFPAAFRSRKMQDLFDTCVRKVKFKRKALPPFSRRLSYALAMPHTLAMIYCTVLSNLYIAWKTSKTKADVKG